MVSERIQRRIARMLVELHIAEASGDWFHVLDRAQDVLQIDGGNLEARAYIESMERRLGLAE